jgi:hypothetical protein
MKFVLAIVSFLGYAYVSNQEFEDRYEIQKHGSEIRQQVQQG